MVLNETAPRAKVMNFSTKKKKKRKEKKKKKLNFEEKY